MSVRRKKVEQKQRRKKFSVQTTQNDLVTYIPLGPQWQVELEWPQEQGLQPMHEMAMMSKRRRKKKKKKKKVDTRQEARRKGR
jgi:hypothetical protein